MNIGWLSASPAATTGYGGQTLEVCSRLMDRHGVTCIGQVGDVIVWGGRQMVDTPQGRKLEVVALADPSSSADVINQYYVPEYKFDILIGFMDAFGIEYLNNVKIPVVGWIPIDGPFTESWKHYVRSFYKVISYSRFGYSELQKWFTPSKIGYIPHGLSEEFRPLERDEIREEYLKKYGIPKDSCLVAFVGANIGMRKEIPQMIMTFARLVKKILSENLPPPHLFLHTNAFEPFPRGYDLITWRRMMGMERYVHFPTYNPIISPASNHELARVNNAADVYWQNSVAEGFGLPIAEALACGRPVIAPLNSSQTELVVGHGWPVECLPEDVYVQIPVYVPQLPTYRVPDQRSALEKLMEAYHSPDLREKYGRAARDYIVRNHSWDIVMNGWFRVLEEIEQEIGFFENLETALK